MAIDGAARRRTLGSLAKEGGRKKWGPGNEKLQSAGIGPETQGKKRAAGEPEGTASVRFPGAPLLLQLPSFEKRGTRGNKCGSSFFSKIPIELMIEESLVAGLKKKERAKALR